MRAIGAAAKKSMNRIIALVDISSVNLLLPESPYEKGISS
jgi:hypothetical protein